MTDLILNKIFTCVECGDKVMRDEIDWGVTDKTVCCSCSEDMKDDNEQAEAEIYDKGCHDYHYRKEND